MNNFSIITDVKHLGVHVGQQTCAMSTPKVLVASLDDLWADPLAVVPNGGIIEFLSINDANVALQRFVVGQPLWSALCSIQNCGSIGRFSSCVLQLSETITETK